MSERYDVAVAGGGMAGIAAALAAAREGAKVLLIEQGGALGGAAVQNLVNPFMKYTYRTEHGREPANAGLFSELLRRLRLRGALPDGLMFSEEALKLVADELTAEYGVETLLHTTLVGTERDGARVAAAELYSTGERSRVEAAFFADCTGDANLLSLAGFPFALGREEDSLCQPMTLCFRLSGVDKELYKAERAGINPLYARFRAEGKILNPRENVLIFDSVCDGILHFNTTRIVKKNPTDPRDLTFAEREARRQVVEIWKFLKENFKCFERSELCMTAPFIGVRESRMARGEYTLTANDILSCRKFPDAIARGVYSIDIHSPDGTGTTIKNIPDNDWYTIPYRSLIPLGAENLLVAGRCLSATHEAQSAVRVMPICFCMGEAAGAALGSLAVSGESDVRAFKDFQRFAV